MFDQMQISVCFELSELERVAAANKMESYTKGGKNIYQIPDKISQFCGVWFKVENRKATLKFSLHKQFNKANFGKLDNSNMFTMAQTRYIFELLENIGVDAAKAKAKYFEIGLNIPIPQPAIEYIKDIQAVGAKGKETFIDANFEKNRQRTTARTKNLKKVFKIYDKIWEMCDRAKVPQIEQTDGGILRVETIYKRQSKKVADLFSPKSLQTLAGQFYADWINATFAKKLESAKGTNSGQQSNAARIFAIGLEGFYSEIKSQYKHGELTERGYRTRREFADNWATNSLKFRQITTKTETTFKNRFRLLMKMAQIVDNQQYKQMTKTTNFAPLKINELQNEL